MFFILVLYLLPVSLVPAFHPTIQSTVSLLCAIVLGYNFPSPIALFQIKYQSTSFFPSSHFTHGSFLLCLTITQVRIPSITEHLSSATMTNYHSPLHPSSCYNPIGWHHTTETFHHTHSSLHKLCFGVMALFEFLNTLDGASGLSWYVGKKLPLFSV